MTSFTRANLTQLRADITAALAPVAAKHGIMLDLGNCKFTDTQARFVKLTAYASASHNAIVPAPSFGQPSTPTVVDGVTDPYNTPMSREYISRALMYALPKDGLGKKFRAGGTVYTIIGLKQSRFKYPVTAEGPQGGKYKFAAQTVKNGLIS